MAARYLGDGFDIHGGGTDLIFPHHENEIAQSEGATGNQFARYWLHNGMVNLGGEKMAKSTGLVVDLGSLLDQVDPAALRLLFLRAHYRSQLEYTADLLDDAEASLDRLRRFEERIDIAPGTAPDAEAMERFTAAMDDDFATPEAVGSALRSGPSGQPSARRRRGCISADGGLPRDRRGPRAARRTAGGGFGRHLSRADGACRATRGTTPGAMASSTIEALLEATAAGTVGQRLRNGRHHQGRSRPVWASCSRTGVRAPAGFGDRVEGLHATAAALATREAHPAHRGARPRRSGAGCRADRTGAPSAESP